MTLIRQDEKEVFKEILVALFVYGLVFLAFLFWLPIILYVWDFYFGK